MRITKLLLICMCCVMVVPTVWAQRANSQAKPGILGYLDPHTGAFRPIAPPAEDSAEPPALTTVTGTINVTLTITVKTAGITNIVCDLGTAVEDNLSTGAFRLFDESNSVAATGTGTTRTCKLSIPYSWSLATQSSDSMSTSYTVVGGGSATLGLPNRTSSLSPLDTRKVPANGTITTLTANVTI